MHVRAALYKFLKRIQEARTSRIRAIMLFRLIRLYIPSAFNDSIYFSR